MFIFAVLVGCLLIGYVYVKYDLRFFWLTALGRPSVSSRTFCRGAS